MTVFWHDTVLADPGRGAGVPNFFGLKAISTKSWHKRKADIHIVAIVKVGLGFERLKGPTFSFATSLKV